MPRNRQKPYFTSDQLDAIVANFIQSSIADGREHDEALVTAVREYANSSKNEYENLILSGVLEGRYTMVVIDDLATFRVADSTPLHFALGFNAEEDEKSLINALREIAHCGKPNATKIVRKPLSKESK